MNWIIAIGLGAAAVGLLFYLIWLIKWRRQGRSRVRRREELRRAMERLGLGIMWETPFYNTRLLGIAGLVEGFPLRMELWEGDRDSCLRLTVWYPRRLRQGVRLRGKGDRWFKYGRRRASVLTGVEAFDQTFNLTSTVGEEERGRQLVSPPIQDELLQLAQEMDHIELGEYGLYMYATRSVEATRAARLINEALQIAARLSQRAAELGPSKAVTKTKYEAQSKMSMEREVDEREVAYLDDFPGGSSRDSSNSGSSNSGGSSSGRGSPASRSPSSSPEGDKT